MFKTFWGFWKYLKIFPSFIIHFSLFSKSPLALKSSFPQFLYCFISFFPNSRCPFSLFQLSKCSFCSVSRLSKFSFSFYQSSLFLIFPSSQLPSLHFPIYLFWLFLGSVPASIYVNLCVCVFGWSVNFLARPCDASQRRTM